MFDPEQMQMRNSTGLGIHMSTFISSRQSAIWFISSRPEQLGHKEIPVIDQNNIEYENLVCQSQISLVNYSAGCLSSTLAANIHKQSWR